MGREVCCADSGGQGLPVIFHETALKGAYVIEPERKEDERGFFARTWCQREFESKGLRAVWVQSSISRNRCKGTLRGMHYQIAPHEEIKVVRCTSGSMYDVIIDLRRHSPTYLKHIDVELSSSNLRMLYIPEGFAHGYQTLDDDTEVLYLMTAFYAPESARGVRWSDPLFDIRWPEDDRIISERDQSYPDFIPEGGKQ